MSVSLSDTELAEIRERVPSAVCSAAHPDEVDRDHVWVTGSLSGALRCSACHLSQRALDSDEAVLLAEVDRLRAELAHAEAERNCFAMALMYARGGDGWTTPFELRRGIDEILATGPAAPKES